MISVPEVLKLLHLLFAFAYVGALVVLERASRAARRTTGWRERAALWSLARGSLWLSGVFPLLLLGVFGNLLAMMGGMSKAQEFWLFWANALWLFSVIVILAYVAPATHRLVNLSRAAAEHEGANPTPEAAAAYDHALRRARLGNALLTVLYIAQLVLMVQRDRLS